MKQYSPITVTDGGAAAALPLLYKVSKYYKSYKYYKNYKTQSTWSPVAL